MSTESRTIRPFLGLGSLEKALSQSLLHFGQESCDPDKSLVVDLTPHEFMLRPVTISWASDDEAFSRLKDDLLSGIGESGIPQAALSIIALASTPFLKKTEVAFVSSLADLEGLSRTIVLSEPERSAALSAPISGFVVDAYLLLNRDLEPRPLRPQRKGTWISASRFQVESSLGPAVLPPTPLTSELRGKLELPARTIRYVDLGEHDLLAPYPDQEQPVFYVDEDLLAELNARGSAPVSKAVQIQLASDFISSVVFGASRRSEDLTQLSYVDIRRSLLGSVIRLAAGPGASDEDRDRLLRRVVSDPDYVIARTEHFIGSGDGFSRALKDAES